MINNTMIHKAHILKTFIIIFIAIFLGNFNAIAQKTIVKGKVTDKSSGYALPFVNVGVKEKAIGTSTDLNGEYILNLDTGTVVITFSSMGYEMRNEKVDIKNDKTIKLNVTLGTTSYNLNTLVITGSKYEQEAQRTINTIEVLKPNLLDNKSGSRVDKSLEQIPGLTIIDNEPQIRAGSGFSSGLGSRVLILMDEIPILRADAGRPAWNFLPTEDIEQIEVIKGASSVIYGSSAVNGAINFRTAYPKEKMETRVKAFVTMYSKPEREYATPWEGMNPILYGAEFKHSHRMGNFDLVLGGSYSHDPGYIGSAIIKPGDGGNTYIDPRYKNEGEYDKRGRFNFATRYRSKKIAGLSAGINGNILYSLNAQTFFWRDSDTNMYRSFPGSVTNFKDFMFYLDPYVKYYKKNGASHALRNRYFYSNNQADNNQSTMSHFVYNEYQYSQKLAKLHDLILTAGVANIYVYCNGHIFSGDTTGNATKKLSDNFSAYMQLEQKILKRLTYLVGGRWEFYDIDGKIENKPIFRAGLNMEMTKATFIRASFGQGYRYPSIGERYISTKVGKFGFYSNPGLKSETSWNVELGVKQFFQIFTFTGFLDVAGFYQRYTNFIEFNAGMWGSSPDITKNFGFKFINTGEAKIQGIDGSLAGQADIGKNFTWNILVGYTFSLPVTLNPHDVYYEDSLRNIHLTYIKSSSDTAGNILKYRVQHLGKFDTELSYKKSISAGFSVRYYSYMVNVDNFFMTLDTPGMLNTGYAGYRETHKSGTFICDARISYNCLKYAGVKHLRLALVMNNIFNTEFSSRPLRADPPRSTSIQVSYTI